ETPKIEVKLVLYAQLLSAYSMIDYVTNAENQQLLENSMEELLEEETMKFVRRTQEEFRGDPFDWHKEARKKFWTWEEYVQYDFIGKYPRAEVKTEYYINIDSFAKQFQPAELNRSG